MRNLVSLAVILFLVGILPAFAFDYARYEAADLDDLMAQRRPRAGVDLHPALPHRLQVTLVSYAEGCRTEFVKRTMVMASIAKDLVDGLKITKCINIRSAKGKQLRVFIQDEVAGFLPKEVPLGTPLTLFVIHLFTKPDGPGLLVNEFSTEAGNDVGRPGSSGQKAEETPPCGCGSADFHPGIDMTNDVEKAVVRAVDDGVVVKVEQDEQASVDVPNVGRCGRYVVIKHSYPNGRAVFTRYAQLGRVAGSDGQPLAPGARISREDRIGEVGSRKILHFEVRPADPDSMEKSEAWNVRYGADPSMEWSRYPSVDPKGFDPDAFGGKATNAK